jgi:hypothetical protein
MTGFYVPIKAGSESVSAKLVLHINQYVHLITDPCMTPSSHLPRQGKGTPLFLERRARLSLEPAGQGTIVASKMALHFNGERC